MTLTDILNEIENKVDTLSKEDLAKLWNWIFGAEEKISADDMSASTKEKEESLKEEVASMLIDEISNSSTKKVVVAYNKLFEEHLTIHDLDKDEKVEDDM